MDRLPEPTQTSATNLPEFHVKGEAATADAVDQQGHQYILNKEGLIKKFTFLDKIENFTRNLLGMDSTAAYKEKLTQPDTQNLAKLESKTKELKDKYEEIKNKKKNIKNEYRELTNEISNTTNQNIKNKLIAQRRTLITPLYEKRQETAKLREEVKTIKSELKGTGINGSYQMKKLEAQDKKLSRIYNKFEGYKLSGHIENAFNQYNREIIDIISSNKWESPQEKEEALNSVISRMNDLKQYAATDAEKELIDDQINQLMPKGEQTRKTVQPSKQQPMPQTHATSKKETPTVESKIILEENKQRGTNLIILAELYDIELTTDQEKILKDPGVLGNEKFNEFCDNLEKELEEKSKIKKDVATDTEKLKKSGATSETAKPHKLTITPEIEQRINEIKTEVKNEEIKLTADQIFTLENATKYNDEGILKKSLDYIEKKLPSYYTKDRIEQMKDDVKNYKIPLNEFEAMALRVKDLEEPKPFSKKSDLAKNLFTLHEKIDTKLSDTESIEKKLLVQNRISKINEELQKINISLSETEKMALDDPSNNEKTIKSIKNKLSIAKRISSINKELQKIDMPLSETERMALKEPHRYIYRPIAFEQILTEIEEKLKNKP